MNATMKCHILISRRPGWPTPRPCIYQHKSTGSRRRAPAPWYRDGVKGQAKYNLPSQTGPILNRKPREAGQEKRQKGGRLSCAKRSVARSTCSGRTGQEMGRCCCLNSVRQRRKSSFYPSHSIPPPPKNRPPRSDNGRVSPSQEMLNKKKHTQKHSCVGTLVILATHRPHAGFIPNRCLKASRPALQHD